MVAIIVWCASIAPATAQPGDNDFGLATPVLTGDSKEQQTDKLDDQVQIPIQDKPISDDTWSAAFERIQHGVLRLPSSAEEESLELLPELPEEDETIDLPYPIDHWCESCLPSHSNEIPVGGSWWWLRQLFAPYNRSHDVGVGQGRLIYAPFAIERSQPLNHFAIRVDSVYNLTLPDRAEYHWARSGGFSGRGPATEQSVDYQDIRFITETGGETFSIATEVPIRVLDPEVNGNTAGMGDMSIASRLVLVDGRRWQLTQFFKTHLLTGATSKGLGTGHVSLEPGVLIRYKWSETTYVHSEIRYWFALPGHPVHAGQVLRTGVGISHLFHETDSFAVIPTLEFVTMSVLDGQKTPFGGVPVDVDGDSVAHIFPGLRFVADTGGDFGLFELGIGGGFDIGSTGWYDSMLRLELRWSR